MKIYGNNSNIYDAVDAVVQHGVAAIEGTKTSAVEYTSRIIRCLSVYSDVAPSIGYQNVMNQGYLYYVYDINRFGDYTTLVAIIRKIDEENF